MFPKLWQYQKSVVNVKETNMRTQTRREHWFSIKLMMLTMLLCILGLTNSAKCQTSAYTGTITGIVTDPSGAIIPGAEVTAIDSATALKTATHTNQDGAFSVPNIAAGTYTVRIKAPGFETFVKTEVLLDPNGV